MLVGLGEGLRGLLSDTLHSTVEYAPPHSMQGLGRFVKIKMGGKYIFGAPICMKKEK